MELMVSLNRTVEMNTKRQLLINKLIEKLPKVKLETIMDINKYYNNNNKYNNLYEKKDINDIIEEYLKDN